MRFKTYITESREPFITDFGAPLEGHGSHGPMTIERYGVWKYDAAKGKHQVVEVGSDLEDLKKKHGVTKVIPLKGTPEAVLPMQRRAT